MPFFCTTHHLYYVLQYEKYTEETSLANTRDPLFMPYKALLNLNDIG